MVAKVRVHPAHLQYTNGLEVLAVEGDTVGECLKQLIKQFPKMDKELFANKDKLLNTVEIFVNHASAYPHELIKPVKDGDEIQLVVMLSGG